MNKPLTSLPIALGLSLLSSTAWAEGFQGWMYGNASKVPIDNPTVTPFDDGTAFVLGPGLINSTNYSAQEYDAKTGAWTIVGKLKHPRAEHVAVALPGNKVLLCGGAQIKTDGFVISPGVTAEIYDHAGKTFTETGKMQSPRFEAAGTLSCDDRTEPLVLVVGGAVSPLVALAKKTFLHSSAEVYRPSTGQWEAAPAMSRTRVLHTATCIPGHGVLVVGGKTAADAQTPLAQATSTATAELFDPVTFTWRPVQSLHHPRHYHTATLLSNGHVVVSGGVNAKGNSLASIEVYDPEADRWTELPDMSVTRSKHEALLLPGDRVLVAGGFSTLGSGEVTTTSVDLYERIAGAGAPDAATWRRLQFPPMISPHVSFGMGLLRGDTVFAASSPVAASPATTETVSLSHDGDPCAQGFECQSGFCVDHVCCQSACDSPCGVCSSGVCQELSCDGHRSCARPAEGPPTCMSSCQSAEDCVVGYACDPTTRACVAPHGTFLSMGCSVTTPGAQAHGAWLLPALLGWLAWRARRRRPLFGALLALLAAGCDSAGTQSLCAPFAQCQMQCVNMRSDPQNCGGCGIACGGAALCIEGHCTSECAGGTALCGERCVDLSVDPASCGACGAACLEGQVCVEGACALPHGLRSYIFPGVHDEGGVHPVEPHFILMADAPATIHYTTDDSMPAPDLPGTSSARSPVLIPPAASGVSQRRIRWFADYDLFGPEAEIHSYTSVIDPSVTAVFGAFVEAPRFAPDNLPLLIVPAGGDVQGAVAYNAWTSKQKGYCPSCIIQIYLGIPTDVSVPNRCISYSYKEYPGIQGTFDFQVKAPAAPGRYPLRWWKDLGLDCSESAAVMGNSEEVGLLIVH